MNKFEQALAIIKDEKLELSNIDNFSQAYFYLNSLKKLVTELEDKVKKKGSVMMTDNDIKNINVKGKTIVWVDPTDIENYNASSVIEALGMERAIAFLKVDSSISKYLKKASSLGAVSMQQVEACRKGLTRTRKKGYLKIQTTK